MNFKHLYYFWTVAHNGSVARASERLNLTPQTLSAQIKQLERSLDTALFRPAGRRLELTEIGRLALRYADEIFALGDEMQAVLASRGGTQALPFRVGITDVMPKALAYRLLAPVRRLSQPVRLICREGKLDRLLAELVLHKLDIVLSDRPLPPQLNVRAHNHKLGESALAFFAAPKLVGECRQFPQCLDDAPMFLPGDDAAVRGRIEHWMEQQRIAPRVIGEFDDGALMKAFGREGGGYFPSPAVLAEEITAQYGVRMVGRVEAVREEFYAITGDPNISHPAVQAVTQTAATALLS